VSLPRACLDCGMPGLPGQSRCPKHTKELGRLKNHKRGNTSLSARVRRELNSAGSGECASCWRTFAAAGLQIDHRVALVDGGSDVISNLCFLCVECHRNKTTEENRRRNERRA